MKHDIYTIPEELPIPQDDGACDHLVGMKVPDVELLSSRNSMVNFSKISGITVIFIFPRTGQPGKLPLVDHWNQIAGARGCTPQTCGFRDLFTDITRKNCSLFGLSTQSPNYHDELKTRLKLQFDVISDENLVLTKLLRLPTFKVLNTTLLKRCALILNDGVVEKVFYPVFPPEDNAKLVLEYLSDRNKKVIFDD